MKIDEVDASKKMNLVWIFYKLHYKLFYCMITSYEIILFINSVFTSSKLSTNPQPNYANAPLVNEDTALDELRGTEHREQMESSATTLLTTKK